MFLQKKWALAAMVIVLIPTAMATGAVQLKFNMDDIPGDDGYFVGTNPVNYNPINWDIDLEDNDPNLAGVNGQSVADANDFVTGLPTGISLTVDPNHIWNEMGPNRSGTLAPGAPASTFFDGESTDVNLFGHTSDFNVGGPRDLVGYTIAGLSSSALYDFTFFASRFGATENRETQYDVSGANSGVDFLDVTDNNNNVAQVLQIQPDALGELTLTIQAGPNNLSADLFFYLGAFEILENGSVAVDDADFDGDGDRDGADFLIWQRGLGLTGQVDNSNGDADGSGTVDGADLAVWESQYAVPPLSGITGTVPEPSSALLLLLGAFGLFGRRSVTR